MTSLVLSRWWSKVSLTLLGFSELRSKLQNHNMLQFFVNGIFEADAYQRESTNTTVVSALLEVKVLPCELTWHWILNIIKGNCCPVKCQAGTEGSIVIALAIFNSYARRKWVVSSKTLPFFPWEKDPISVVEEGMWISRSIWMGPENLAQLSFKFRIL